VSGLAYVPEKDLLILTASEEETSDSYNDGVIGESYLGLVSEVSDKLAQPEIAPDQWITLTEIHKNFIGQKIESVCALAPEGDKLILFLVADNDTGTTGIFNLQLHL
jgi:hypothetical protein